MWRQCCRRLQPFSTSTVLMMFLSFSRPHCCFSLQSLKTFLVGQSKNRALSTLCWTGIDINQQRIDSLLAIATARAQRTLSKFAPDNNDFNSSSNQEAPFSSVTPTTVIDDVLPRPSNTTTLYGRNPTVTMTALAHSQWSYILRPGIDSAIDATAGNGGDSLVMAKLLFQPTTEGGGHSKLLCFDVDPQACESARKGLASCFPDLMDNSIHILETSHDPLPLPVDSASRGLVAYNLGYLPGATETFMTDVSSTLSSMAQAARVIRVGGMLSVMTYPATNAVEDDLVRAFVTGLALFSSRTMDWTTHPYRSDQPDQNQQVLEKLQYVYDHQSTAVWRVHEHKKLGWIDAPILFTATRIK